MTDGKNIFKGTDGRYYCAKCKEPVEEFYSKGSVKENKKHHRPCACERERYAKDVRYHKEKEQRERIARNRSICFSEKVMQNWTFENAKKDNLALEIARKYAANWKEMKRQHMGYMFWGPVGTGKSFLAGCIANALLNQGVCVKMTNFNTILNDLFALQEKEEYIQALSKYELLIIDDFGMERNTEYALENIFSVLDRRCCSERPLIITTNLSLTSMKQRSDLLKKRIYDRVLQMCVPVKVDGESRRKKIASENLQIMKTIIQNQ